MNLKYSFVVSIFILFSACGSNENDSQTASKENSTISEKKNIEFEIPDYNLQQPQTNRWYTQDQIKLGEIKFIQVCANCHKKDASGTTNWKESKNGVYPPPPLNGNAHAWHHPLVQLHNTIKEGTADLGGNMPAWGRVLSDEEILATIAFFQSKWSDEIYQTWLERN